MLNGLVQTIADLWNAPDQWIEAELEQVMPVEAAPPPSAGHMFRTRFLDLARYRQKQNGKVVSSLLTIVWQGAKLTPLAAQFREIKALTALVAEVVLEQMAGQPDFFLQYDSNNIVVCFASGNKAVTEVRTAMMAQALRAALLQRMPSLAGQVRIDFVVTTVEPIEAVKGPDLAAGLVDTLCRLRDASAVGNAVTA